MAVFFIAFAVVVSNLFLGALAFSKNPKSATHRLFLLLTVILALWAVANSISVTVQSKEDIFFWVKAVMVITSAMFSTIYLLSATYPHNNFILPKKWVLLTVVITFVTQILVVSNQVFQRVDFANGIPAPVSGSGMVVFAANILGFFTLSIITLIKKYRQALGMEKTQLKYLLFGIITTFVLTNLTNFIFVNVLHLTEFVAIGPAFTLLLVGSISYAIIKHRFLDIRLVVARTVSFASLLGLLGILYALFFAYLSVIFSKASIEVRTVAVSTILALIMAFSFQYIRRILEKITDKFLYQNHYDPSKLLYDLALIMSSTLRLEDLTHQILQKLLKEMRITRGALILTEQGYIYQVASEGYSKIPELDEEKISSLMSPKQTIIMEELTETDARKELMRSLDLTVVEPLYSESHDIGLLVLGEKLSGDLYTPEDIRVLEILAPEVAVAIQNARSYEEIRRFNVILQGKVAQATSSLSIANDKLQELDKLKDDFVSVASHELRTPMTAIRSYAWMALHKSDIPLSDRLKKYLDRTITSTERLIKLVNDMLNISRIESGRVEILPEVFNIQTFVSDIFMEVGVRAKEKNLLLKIIYSTIPKVFADRDKVHQVLLNLIGNSIKFTPDAGIITVSFFSDGNSIETSIEDTGIGLDSGDLPSLFKKFSRLDNSYISSAASGGTGLGLYICKNLIELMGGKIWAKSDGIGKGAIFTFSLPVATNNILANSQNFIKKVNGGARMLEPVAI
ncbi:hypothetical protein HYW46_07155 [Candidatus Daviesbacteria bacterium]|nr:hypothetical protein [Candidatus Daviesbacteria bacterium]